jgi:hypothetical protein
MLTVDLKGAIIKENPAHGEALFGFQEVYAILYNIIIPHLK